MSDLRSALRDAMTTQGVTYEQLRDRSGICCDLSSLNRKLSGAQELKGRDAVLLANALKVKVPLLERALRLAAELGADIAWSPPSRRRVAS